MAKTVVDELIVLFGLDPSEFKKGQKEIAAALIETENESKQSSQRMSSNIGAVAAKYLTVAAAILVVKKAWSFVTDAATETRRLGQDSKNFGIAANEMRNFQNAVEMMGGTAEDATRTIGGFEKAIFDLTYQGQISDSLVMLARLGVQFQDASGNARNFKDVLLDTAGALETAQKNGTMSRENAFQYLQAAGFDKGSAQIALLGRAGAETELARQGSLRQVSASDVGKATEADRARIGRDQAVQAAGVASVSAGGGIVEAVNNFATHAIKLASGQESLTDATKDLRSTISTKVDSIMAGAHTWAQSYNNPGNIRAVGDQPRNAAGFRVFTSRAAGIQAMNAQLDRYAAKGIDTIDSIVKTWAPASDGNDVPAYIRDVSQRTGIKPGQKLTAADRPSLIAAMSHHESPRNSVLEPEIKDALGASAPPTPRAQGGNVSNRTDVQIDRIEINTAATDAHGIARDTDSAMKRKLLASHIEPGQQ